MTAAEAGRLTPDGVFELLSNHRRRMVLYYLRTNGGSVDVQELATEIAAMENDVPPDELTSQQRKRVYVSLYQTHLPKMAELNTVDYDKDAGVVRLAPRAADVDRYLTTEDGPSYPWRFHYLVLAVAGAVAVALLAVNAPGFGALSLSALGAGIFVAFAGSAIGQYWHARTDADEVPVELSRYDR
jgi:hypothetical protein